MKESFDGNEPLEIRYGGTEVSDSTNHVLQDLLNCEGASDLLTASRLVSLQPSQVVYKQGDKIETLYFPLNSVISNLGIMEDGTTLETSMIGCEGLVESLRFLAVELANNGAGY